MLMYKRRLSVGFRILFFYLCAFFAPPFNLFGEEIEAQRTGGLIKVDILAVKLIALHEQVGF